MNVRAQLSAPGTPGVVPTTHFEAADDRPAGYPEALPFVPGLSVSVTELRAGMNHGPSAQWWGVDDPDAVLSSLVRGSVEDGWEQVTDDEAPALAASLVRMRRGGRGRTIIASRVGPVGMVTLADRALS